MESSSSQIAAVSRTVWTQKPADPVAVEALCGALACPESIAQLLVSLGMTDEAAARAFLNPSLAAFLSDPDTDPQLLLGMDLAADRVLRALRDREPILIYGDYDVDGTTATVLLKTTLERVALAIDPSKSADVRYHVPHRILEGYGMQATVLARAAAAGVRLVISVDTGIRAIAEAEEARALGLDLIVTDHHLPDDARLPECFAVINPAQPGCPYPNKFLCGAAVAFKLAHALLIAAAPLTADSSSFRARTDGVLLPSFLKLVAIATVADAVPLKGENRMIAALGLAGLANPVQPGLRALMEFAKLPLDRAPSATEVAFRIAPRINAAGRMDVASEVVELFLTRDVARARTLAEKLDRLNTERRDSEATALAAIDRTLLTLLSDEGDYPPDCLILDDPEWHRGVLGILASRVVERTGRPALVVTHANGDAHGSGRSIPGFHLLDAITAAEMRDAENALFHRFGGHAHAVGFSLPSERLAELRARMSAHAAQALTPEVLTPTLAYDAELDLSEITPSLFDWVERLAPFGHGNPEPVFLSREATLSGAPRVIKERHVCLELLVPQPPDGGPNITIQALGWTRGEGAASDRGSWAARSASMNLDQDSRVDVLFRLRRKTGAWANPATGGLELEMVDLRPSRAAGKVEANPSM